MDLWEALRERLDYVRFVPRVIPDLERFEYRGRDGRRRTIIKNPRGAGGSGTYLSLPDDEENELLALMDGQRSIREILVEHLKQRRVLALDRLGRLTAALAANGFFGEERPEVFLRLRRRRASRRPLARLQLLLRRMILWNVAEWSNAHGPIDLIYRVAGRPFFSRVGLLVVALFIAVGLALWSGELRAGRHDVIRLANSYVLGLLAYLAGLVVGISFHELGHGLAVRHYGRSVRRAGLAIYYLVPCAYVETTDMVMAPRAARIVVSAAGPLAGLAFAAAAAMVAAAAPAGSLVGSIAIKAASVLVFQNLFQLVPILELDGYHILVDALDVPRLRPRALGFVRTRLVPKLLARSPFTLEETGLAVFGLLAVATSMAMLFFGLWLWRTRLGVVAQELWQQPLGRLGFLFFVLVFLGPLLLGLAAQAYSWGTPLVRAATSGRERERRQRIAERAAALRRTSFFRDLKPLALEALASHVDEVRAPPGEAVVREGEPGDRFYVIVEGEADAVQGPEEQHLRTLGPGDPFGEIALLRRVPRTATVRARTPLRLFALDRGHFHRWAADRLEVTARVRSSLELRERLERSPIFAPLSPGELDRIATRMRVRRVAAGQNVFKQGDAGDRGYVIEDGTVEVIVDEAAVRRMGAGELVGELALLTKAPRSATVRAVTDVTLFAFGPDDLDELLRASAETQSALVAQQESYVMGSVAAAVTK